MSRSRPKCAVDISADGSAVGDVEYFFNPYWCLSVIFLFSLLLLEMCQLLISAVVAYVRTGYLVVFCTVVLL